MKCVTALVITSFVHILYLCNGQAFKGIKMCQRDCELTKGCTGIYYVPVHLQCCLLFNLEKNDEGMTSVVIKLIVKTSLRNDVLKTCSTGDRVVVTRMGKDVCVQTEADTTRQEYSRLLIAGSKWYQLELKTRVVQWMSSLWKHVYCVTYLKIANRFVVSYRDRVFTTPVTDMKESRIRRHIRVSGIDADEEKNVIFLLILKKRGNEICTMNLAGAHLRCFAAEGMLGLFAIDTNHKRVYIYSKSKVASYTYNGTLILEYGQKIHCSTAMVYDSVKDVLYCSFGSRLTVITNTGRQTIVPDFKQFVTANGIKIHSSYIYMSSSRERNAVFVADVESRFKVQKIKLPEDQLGYRLCLF